MVESPVTPPGAVSGLTATPGDRKVTLKWEEPQSNGGSMITRYEYEVGDGTWVSTGATATEYVVTGRTNGTPYIFAVRAVNALGEGPASNEASATPMGAPGKPTGLSATSGDGEVTLRWAAPQSNGGSMITRYEYEVGDGTWVSAGATATEYVVTGRTNGTPYTFAVRAVNALGEGPASDVTSATPMGAPGKPTGLSATSGDGEVTLRWAAPQSNGGSMITRYEYEVGDGTWVSTGATATEYVVTGRTNGTQYTFAVRAVNALGEGPASDVTSATPMGVSGAPRNLSATPGDREVTLRWEAPQSNGGSTITDYMYQVGDGTWVSSGATATEYVVTGRTNGTQYIFAVRAVNALGEGPASNVATATPLGAPDAPRNLSATPGDREVTLSWEAPQSNGGSTITHYEYKVGDGTWVSTGATATEYVVTGRTNGTQYTFAVRAVNALGEGPASDVTSATPMGAPGKPTGLSATSGDGEVTLSWEAPQSNGGSTITDYMYQVGDGTWVSTGATATEYVVTGRTNGTQYIFAVRAVNALGEGPASNVATATPLGAPDAPRNLSATPGDREVTLRWEAPASTGGTPIIHYEYRTGGGAWLETEQPTSHVVDDLTNGAQYMFGVRAINAVTTERPDMEPAYASVSSVPDIPHEVEEAVIETVQAVTAATAANIASNIGTRFSAARSGSTVVVGGQTANLGFAPAAALHPIDTDRDPFAEDDDFSHSRSLGFDELLRTSAFEISLNAAEDEGQGGSGAAQWTIWGRGDLQYFQSLPERGSTFDGNLKAGYLGVDARVDERWLVGMATSVTQTEADYGLGDAGDGDGRLETRITGLHPYLRYAPDARTEFWSILGMGRGEIENRRPTSDELETSEISMQMAAAGGRRALETEGAFGLSVLGDLGLARVETDDGAGAIQGITVNAWRARLGVEGSHTALLESGYSVTTFAEVAGRYDGGVDEDEMGLEISPGVYVAGPNGLGFEVRGRMLALHTAENYEEYGASMTLSMSPRPDGRGLSLSISPRTGAETGSAETLWREDPFALSGARSEERNALSLDIGMGYGIRAKNGLLTPFGELSLRDEGSRRLRAGARFNLMRSSLGMLSLELSGERHESEGADPEHRVGVTGRLRF